MGMGQTLRVTAVVDNLPAIREFVHDAAVAHGLSAEALDGVVLAVDEAVTNIIVHGYDGDDGMIEIDVGCNGKSLSIRVRDDAPVFDPTQALPPDLTIPLEERPPGGLGIYLMRRNVDEVIHRAMLPGGNELMLIKHIKHSES